MKKITMMLVSIILVLCSAFSLVGCFGGGQEQRDEEGWDVTEGKLSIISSNPELTNFMADMIDEFQSENPKIKVEFEAVPTDKYANLLNSRFLANAVDIYAIQPGSTISSAVNLARCNSLDKLNIWKDIKPEVKADVSYEGKTLMAPTSVAENVVFYKADKLKAYKNETGKGLPTNWSEFVDLLNWMKSKGYYIQYGGKDQWSVAMIHSQLQATIVQPEYPNVFEKVVKDNFKFAEDEFAIKTMERFRAIMSGGYFQPNAAGAEYSAAPGDFVVNDKACLTIDGSWSLRQIRDAIKASPNKDMEIGVFLLPGNDDAAKNNKYPTKVASAWSIAKSSKKKAMAAKFLEFLFRTENYTRYVDSQYCESVMSGIVASDPVISKLMDVEKTLTFDNMIVPRMPYDEYLKLTIGPKFMTGELSAADALKNIDNDIQKDKTLWNKEVDSWLKRW